MTNEIAEALTQLADAEARLRALGVVRTRNIVGDLAEHVAISSASIHQRIRRHGR